MLIFFLNNDFNDFNDYNHFNYNYDYFLQL